MKNRVVYVDFVRKSVKANPVELSFKENLIRSFIKKIKTLFSSNNDNTKNRKHAYGYKHTM
jgi:hypothetical protein